ncbi:hypothetical protein ANCDUO_23415 [Ancylostoma duodenale]|uniref:Serpin domain-containing protein n=1 Tax=Ancylostoma duodenale TaxID=51022 RepID=A0A0C2FDB1_9BILA|nr:hypothetical protein ANCDUO_23415 [Ancylostoma duodenale]
MAIHALKNCRFTIAHGTQVLALPYKDKEYEFVIFLPLESVKFEEFRVNLTGAIMKELLETADKESAGVNVSSSIKDLEELISTELWPFLVKVTIPKFKTTSQPQMKHMLQQLGINQLFEGGCDLKGVCETEDLFVDDVIHKAVVEVSEEGTKAAAATGMVMMRRRPMPQLPPPTFRADHPFAYGIFLLGEPIFIGQYC